MLRNYQSCTERGYLVTKQASMTVLVTMSMEKELATFLLLPVPNTPVLSDHFNASVACISKQRGCSSEDTEENLRAS